ncbi:hypothetical protein [Paenibacillus contaminans]|jgi:hypothetical protein|uniref:DUF2642 domain-containing protein n=1 Tax=Paenibacillus contaminans TaxID=450362 RepID=A0A329ML96_9BACL|nr:hypothetical protein [Paenibacillus contaminans]RAV20076.1 hypothetical protein DQG23_16525 [Paenibacillus contaminans]
MSSTLSGDLVPLIGSEVTAVTNAFGQLTVIGTLARVGNDYILVSFTDNGFLYEIRVSFANLVYVHANP